MKTFDVIVVGAGIVGLSIAWQLARRGRLKVLVVEKSNAPAAGSTGASSAICRFRYSRDDMVALARDGIHAYHQWQDFTQLTSPRAGFQRDGTLWLTGQDTAFAPQEQRRMATLGVQTEVLDDDDLARRFPVFNPCTRTPDLETGADHVCQGGGVHLFETDGGFMDPVAAAEDLVEAGRNHGISYSFGSPVARIRHQGGKITGVELGSGEIISGPLVINAAGPWCNALNDLAGVHVPWNLVPTRIQVLYLDRAPELQGHIPVTADVPGGIYFRTQNQGQQLVVGSVRESDERETVDNPDNFQRTHDDEFAYTQLHVLSHRIPALPQHGKVRGYCGLYTVNRDDVHPVLGPTELEGYWVANGFSGHGFKLAPAIGAMLAAAIDGPVSGPDDEYGTQVPLETFAVDRKPLDVESKSVLA